MYLTCSKLVNINFFFYCKPFNEILRSFVSVTSLMHLLFYVSMQFKIIFIMYILIISLNLCLLFPLLCFISIYQYSFLLLRYTFLVCLVILMLAIPLLQILLLIYISVVLNILFISYNADKSISFKLQMQTIFIHQ